MKKLDKLFFGNVWNFFTSKNKTTPYIIFILLIGLVLRFLAASHLAPSADEAVYGTHAINFINSGAVSNQNQSPVWFFLADLFYKIFGISLVTARFTSVIFSLFTIFLVYLISKELFDEKLALIAAFLFSISAYSSRYMVMEMDPTFTFFFFLSAYLFIRDLFHKDRISLLSAVFLGIAILSKAISLMLAPSFILIYLMYFIKNKEKRKILSGKENIKKAIMSIVIVLMLLTPILTYNYLLYKEKGLTDVMFARFFGTSKEFYAPISNTIQPFSFSVFFENIASPMKTILNFDLVLVVLSIIGVIIAIIKNRFQLLILLSLLIPVYVLITGTSLLGNHFVVFLPIVIIFSSIPIYYLHRKLNKKNIIFLILMVILLFNLYILKETITSRSAIGALREFTIENIDETSLVIADARIYRGRIAWMFNDKHYVEASLLNDVYKPLQHIQSVEVPIKTYFIECVKDDCGWGTIKDQPEFNQSMENLVSQFDKISDKKTDIVGGGGYDEIPNEIYFRIYEATIQSKLQILQEVDKTHHFFFYPVRWTPREAIYDAYTPKGLFNKTLNILAHLVLYLSVLIAISALPYTLYLIYKNLKKEHVM